MTISPQRAHDLLI